MMKIECFGKDNNPYFEMIKGVILTYGKMFECVQPPDLEAVSSASGYNVLEVRDILDLYGLGYRVNGEAVNTAQNKLWARKLLR